MMGPYFNLSKGDEVKVEAIKNITNKLVKNNLLMDTVRNLFIMAYVLNSQQIVIAVLLMNIYTPINFYEVLRMFGTFIFGYISGWCQFPDELKYQVLWTWMKGYLLEPAPGEQFRNV